jgi:Divergent InlB B-repeat domain
VPKLFMVSLMALVFALVAPAVAGASYPYPVSVTVTGPGSVTDAADLINCPTACSAEYPSGMTATFTATPQAGAQFGGWSTSAQIFSGCTSTSANCVIRIDCDACGASESVSATFDPVLVAAVTGSGTVTGSGGINCPTACSFAATPGQQITLNAAPASGYQFSTWSGDGCTGQTATCSFTIQSGQTVTANFTVLTRTATTPAATTPTPTTPASGAVTPAVLDKSNSKITAVLSSTTAAVLGAKGLVIKVTTVTGANVTLHLILDKRTAKVVHLGNGSRDVVVGAATVHDIETSTETIRAVLTKKARAALSRLHKSFKLTLRTSFSLGGYAYTINREETIKLAALKQARTTA